MYFELCCSLIHSVKACCLHKSNLYKSIAKMILLCSELCILTLLVTHVTIFMYIEKKTFASYCFLLLFFFHLYA